MKEVWGYSHDRGTEGWDGEYATREECIRAGRKVHAGAPFWIMRGLQAGGDYFMPDAETILDMVKEVAEGEGIPKEDWEVDEDSLGYLDELLTAWARSRLDVPGWRAIGKPERVAASREDA